MPRVGHTLINESNETFEKPSVIICNHQSHLDLMYLLQISPKIIVLTNHWVWHSPFYGKIIRKAQFISVEDGFENCVEPLKQLVDEGYSIAIFPEGTRSSDCSILPFHNGAFYLAEKLNLDIVPIIFHGIGHVLPKREMIFRKGSVVTKILPRISSEELKNGIKYGDKPLRQAQIFRQLYIKEYNSIVKERENFTYLYDRIRGFYMYKGADILKAADEELAVLKNYPGHAWNSANDGSFDAKVLAIPQNGTVCYEDCKMGVEPLAVALMRNDVKVMISADNDEDADLLRVISENCGGNLVFGKASKVPVSEEVVKTDDMPDEPVLF
jgi:1-acyl-sn-glycerol-3-phosphate acyltransferase